MLWAGSSGPAAPQFQRQAGCLQLGYCREQGLKGTPWGRKPGPGLWLRKRDRVGFPDGRGKLEVTVLYLGAYTGSYRQGLRAISRPGPFLSPATRSAISTSIPWAGNPKHHWKTTFWAGGLARTKES